MKTKSKITKKIYIYIYVDKDLVWLGKKKNKKLDNARK